MPTSPLAEPVCRWAYRRVLRALGGRKAVPRGGPLDCLLRECFRETAVIGACRERDHGLSVLRRMREAEFFDSDVGLLARAEQQIVSVSVRDVIRGER